MSGMRRRTALTGSPLSASLAQWTQPGIIKSLQSSTITYTLGSGTATITTVDPNNSLVLFHGQTTAAVNPDYQVSFARLALTNSTTVTATGFNDGASKVASFTVIEFVPGVLKSVQRGTITLTGVTSNTATITTVNTGKSSLVFLGSSASSAGAENTDVWTFKLVLTNATTVTANHITAGAGTLVVAYQVAEFF